MSVFPPLPSRRMLPLETSVAVALSVGWWGIACLESTIVDGFVPVAMGVECKYNAFQISQKLLNKNYDVVLVGR